MRAARSMSGYIGPQHYRAAAHTYISVPACCEELRARMHVSTKGAQQ